MAKRNNYKQHQTIGGWKLQQRLGKGGNGEVWQAVKNGESGAIKLLKNIRASIYSRFKAEVHALENNQDIHGVIKIKEYQLPESTEKTVPWFVMPVAQKFSDWRKSKDVISTVKAMLKIAETLSALHDRKFSHRDIKPANILFLDGRLYLADFGLVKYPNRDDVTTKGSDVGPKYTMAPEMRRYAHEADGLKADVYSFAKTLWIAITGELKCFDGQYNAFSTISINNYCHGIYTKSLNDLLAECTEHEPDNRPDMHTVISKLQQWLQINEDFHDQNLTEWFDLQNKLFPAGSPRSVTWTDPSDIVTVLNEIGRVPSLNHMFLPGGGGNTFKGAATANEKGFISLKISEKTFYLINPKKLTYESFGVDPQWNYFRLESNTIKNTGIYPASSYIFSYEELVEIAPAQYIERDYWDIGEYNGQPIPNHANLICRYYEGCFVIFSTRSHYNLDSGTYDGRHNKMSEDTFRGYIERNA